MDSTHDRQNPVHNLIQAVMLPTPMASDSTLRGYQRDKRGNASLSLPGVIRYLPTPRARDWLSEKSNCENSRPLNEVVAGGGQFPLHRAGFVRLREYLMGWPIGWSGLAPLATVRFQQWWPKHGGF